MLRGLEQPRSLQIAAIMLAITANAVLLPQEISAGEPVLYGPTETHIEYIDDPYVAPAYPEGNRLYGLRNFKPPGRNIYEPPPIYRPRGFFPGPFWPFYGFYGPGLWGPYGGFYYFSGY